MSVRLKIAVGLLLLWAARPAPALAASDTLNVVVGGRSQSLKMYRPDGPPKAVVVLSSGDLGWSGFVVEVAEFLQTQRIGVVGISTRAYLASFTSGKTTLNPADIPGHYEVIAREAQRAFGTSTRPILIGISEGAGLSVVAASDSTRHSLYGGVIGLGLPESIELGWNTWKDWTIWITKGDPDQPHMSIDPHIRRVSPLPIVVVQSSRDEFIPAEETGRLVQSAQEPKRLITIDAKNHRFSDRRTELRQALLDAMGWVEERPR